MQEIMEKIEQILEVLLSIDSRISIIEKQLLSKVSNNLQGKVEKWAQSFPEK